MKNMKFMALALAAAAVVLISLAEPALATKPHEVSQGMKIWNLTWRILNFLILAGLLFKLMKDPFKKFLKDKKASYAVEIDSMEQAKAEAQEQLAEIQGKIAGMQGELDAYQEAMQRQAQRQRDEIIAASEREAQLILERAENQAARALESAKRSLAAEMVEVAAEIATEKISAAITPQDRADLIDTFATQVAK